MKADVGKIKSSIENYLIRNSISSTDDMSKSELRNMISHVTTSICRDSNLGEDVIRDAIDEILRVSNIAVQDINENQGEEAPQHIHTAQNINSPQNVNAPQGNNTELNTDGLQNNNRREQNTSKSQNNRREQNTSESQKNNREQNKNEFTVKDINRFAQVINESIVKTVAGNKFLNIAQEINNMKEAEISTKAAAEDATGDDDTELININRYIDNL